MYEGKTLALILCMHRSGSSLATNVLSELGMSLGPFTMLGATPANPHGHFESREFCVLNQALQYQAFGFADDMPGSPETLQRFLERGGRWSDGDDRPPQWLEQGEELVQRLVASAPLSGFKDPRLPLMWPFWAEVLRRMSGLRVIPLLLLRSPHEIAMSVFMRSKGRFDYGDALDVTAVHYQRMAAILADWPGPLARVRFLPEYFIEDLRAACRVLGLAWNDEVYARVFDAECKHHEPAAVGHPAQALFEQLAELPAQSFGAENVARIAADALLRERLLRQNQADAQQAQKEAQAEVAENRSALADAQATLSAVQDELFAVRGQLSATAAKATRLAAELDVARTSRIWRLRNMLVTVPGLKQLASRSLITSTSAEVQAGEG